MRHRQALSLVVVAAVVVAVAAVALWLRETRVAGAGASAATPGTAARGASTDQRVAAAVVIALARAGLPVADPVRCAAPSPTSATPPPSVAFRDPGIDRAYPRPLVAAGGVVEAFGSAADVERRIAELDEQLSVAHAYGFDEGGRLLHPERRYAQGRMLLRLSGFLGAETAQRYADVFARVATRLSADRPSFDLSDPALDLKEVPCST